MQLTILQRVLTIRRPTIHEHRSIEKPEQIRVSAKTPFALTSINPESISGPTKYTCALFVDMTYTEVDRNLAKFERTRF
jgi:hypothetical protein